MSESHDLTIYDRFQQPGQLIEQLGKDICLSEMFGCSNASQGRVLAVECAARKCPPMSLAERYHIIHGRLSMKSDAMLADFRAKLGGNHRVIARTPDRAAIELTIGGNTQTFELTWEDAQEEAFVYVGKEASVAERLAKGKRSGLMLKAKYSRPRARMQMLWARVVSDGVRAMAPEVVAGYYTPEEIEDYAEVPAREVDVVEVEAEVVEAEPEPEPAKPGVKLSGKRQTGVGTSAQEPCGEAIADTIKMAARGLEMPPERLAAVTTERHGVERIADIPLDAAEILLARLNKMRAEKEAPF